MNDGDVKKIRGVVKEEIETALKPVSKKLDILWEQVEKVTIELDQVQETQQVHTRVLKSIDAKVENHSDDIHKLNKRVITLENTSGIVPPPELTI